MSVNCCFRERGEEREGKMEDDKEEEAACLITTQSARLSRAKDNRRSRGIKVRFSRPWRGRNYAQESDSLLFYHFRKHVVTFLPGLRFLREASG